VRKHLETYKPAAPAHVHLLLAAIMWSAVGAGLLLFGVRWAGAGHLPAQWLLVGLAGVVGALKARYVLRRTALRMIQRIGERGDGRCIGGFLSVRSWLLVVVMTTMGRLVRGSDLPRAVVGLIYVTIGAALLLASGYVWQARRRHRAQS